MVQHYICAISPDVLHIVANVSGSGKANYTVEGIGWGTTFGCCGNENAVDFHVVFRDAAHNLRSQARPSPIACNGGVTLAYQEKGLIQFAGPGLLHTLQHKINKIRRLGDHCSSKLELTAAEMASGARPLDPQYN